MRAVHKTEKILMWDKSNEFSSQRKHLKCHTKTTLTKSANIPEPISRLILPGNSSGHISQTIELHKKGNVNTTNLPKSEMNGKHQNSAQPFKSNK